MSTLVFILIGALVVLRVLGKQLVGSVVTARSLVLMPAILIVIGLGSAASAISLAKPGEILFFLLDAVIVVGLGLARGASTRLSVRDGGLFQKGTALTLVLWLATIAIRVGAVFLGQSLGVAGTLTTASVLLLFGATIAAQNAVIYFRAQQQRLPLTAAAPRR
ncbi:hypothetical protein [Kutzneria sp. CA-103260]|uniref:hypothetical protein n=1 Tax=Kutzneria sp. CA-103260 TaxID=2802641 RepID=UPI001BA79684|nr:hypothetical protein [Kutzneria sp. CA-103260]QUQ71883.1 hypothetical protein JJ691_96700 [Kutzneria sp. CA-103260]